MSRTIEDLPLELICSILEELAPSVEPYNEADGLNWLDLQTHCSPTHNELELVQNLATCSLVCRLWHEITLPLLFRTLRLQVSPEGRGKGLSEALTWLETVPWICSCVKNVQFTVPMVDAFASDLPDDDSQYYSLTLLYKVLDMLPRLQEVAMQDILLKPYASQTIIPPRRVFNLNRFSFIIRHRSPFDMCLTDVLSLFPWLGQVKRVSLQRIFGIRPPHSLVKAPAGLHIDTLDISSISCIHGLTQILASTPSFHTRGLRSLSLNLNAIPGRFDEGDIGEFLTLVGPRLEEFHCNVGWFIARESTMSSLVRSWQLHSNSTLHPLSLAAHRDIRLDLSGFVALKKLRLMFYTMGESGEEGVRADVRAVGDILSTLVVDHHSTCFPSVLEDVILSLVLDDSLDDTERRVPGRYLATACAEELSRIQCSMTRLRMLQQFRIVRQGRKAVEFGEEDKAALRSALPLLEGRGLLCF